MSGQEIMTLFGKLGVREDDRTISPKSESRFFFFFFLTLIGKGVSLVISNFLVLESFVLAAVHVGQMMMFL